eukprot:CAMPEP_0179166556 /NCGR_PEP_ID=MMETSP0796-20121207/81836_1 /TAXON_ID=73915 /ORGANISM="Pyrodinium bahamense, Strain pbaha01" /LENGTH=47 /DNA_ID= /DNA_START= /DNA_END= /DNA_ORIENTATION=
MSLSMTCSCASGSSVRNSCATFSSRLNLRMYSSTAPPPPVAAPATAS